MRHFEQRAGAWYEQWLASGDDALLRKIREYNLDDVRALCAVQEEGITGAITGRAIYEGTLQFAEAQALADQLSKPPL